MTPLQRFRERTEKSLEMYPVQDHSIEDIGLAAKELVLELIGDDETIHGSDIGSHEAHGANRLRANIRAKLEGGKDENDIR